MIDISAEHLLSMSQAARLRPHGRMDRPTHPSTIYRWMFRGIKGPTGVVRLEGIRIGGSWYTSREALQRFSERLSATVAVALPRAVNGNADVGRATAANDSLERRGY